MKIKLRPWQIEAIQKCLDWYSNNDKDTQFIINAAPGSGKTIAACSIAQQLIEKNEIDRVIIIAPRTEVVNQWSNDFKMITNLSMSKVTASDLDIDSLDIDICATWAAIQGLTETLKSICSKKRVLVICDEHHHAALEAAWGISADSAFKQSKYTLILTGTPVRSDGSKSVWLSYDEVGYIKCSKEACYNLTYGEAVDLGYCRPCTFHRHEGNFTIADSNGEIIAEVSSKKTKILSNSSQVSKVLKKTLDFYKSARTRRYEKDNITPLKIGYQGTMLDWGSKKLDQIRNIMPEAGGLVIAPDIQMAEYMSKILEMIEGEAPILVHSKMNSSDSRIKLYRESNKRWIVSVNMISEGVDIRRLRVLVYLPNALTNLAFRQAIGRVVRTNGPDDDTRAYVVMPSIKILEGYARRVEEEISPNLRKETKINHKKCPSCHNKCKLSDKKCNVCGHEFPVLNKLSTKNCSECGHQNPINASNCSKCGNSFHQSFSLTLKEALREGAIVRGIDVTEEEVKAGEKMAKSLRDQMLRSGDDVFIEILKKVPEESLARFLSIAENLGENR